MSWKFINVVKLVPVQAKKCNICKLCRYNQLSYLLLNFLTGRRPLKWNCDFKSTKTWDTWTEHLFNLISYFQDTGPAFSLAQH